MRKSKLKFAGALATAFLFVATMAYAQAAPNFVGTWQMQVTGGQGGPGGGGGQGGNGGGGGGQHRGMGPSTLVITQDGDHYKVEHNTQRGDTTASATASGNTLTWSEEREGRDGNKMTINWKASIDGDTMKGTLGGGQFSRDFTAKRGS